MIQPGKTIRIAAAVIVDPAGRLLLVRKRGTLSFMQPGGKIEPGEAPREAVIRELQEELGLSIDPAALRYLGGFSSKAANEPGATVEAELFEAASTGTPQPAAEIEEMIWFDPARDGTTALAPLTQDFVLPRYC